MRLAALISGGKDSALALHRILEKGMEVKYLVTMIPLRDDSWMFHYPNIHLTDLFAEAAGIPLIKAQTSGEKEKELEDLKNVLSTLNVDGVISGAVASSYQKNRIERICNELGIRSITPIWHEDPIKLMKELISLKFDVIIVGVYAYGFNREWLGRHIDPKTLNDLIELNRRYNISIVGEGGEYETFVLYAPFFKRRIRIIEAETVWRNSNGYLSIKRAALA